MNAVTTQQTTGMVPFAGYIPNKQGSVSGALASAVTERVPRISCEDGKFTCFVNGQRLGESIEEIPVVIVGMHPPGRETSRSYFSKRYQRGLQAKPDCFSDDGVTPSAKSPTVQSATCDTCTQNANGSGVGGEGRACRFSKTLAVVIPGDQQGRVFSLRLPATSIFQPHAEGADHMGLLAAAGEITARGLSSTQVVFDMGFYEGSKAGPMFIPSSVIVDENIVNHYEDLCGSESTKKLLTYGVENSFNTAAETAAITPTPAPAPVAQRKSPFAAAPAAAAPAAAAPAAAAPAAAAPMPPEPNGGLLQMMEAPTRMVADVVAPAAVAPAAVAPAAVAPAAIAPTSAPLKPVAAVKPSAAATRLAAMQAALGLSS